MKKSQLVPPIVTTLLLACGGGQAPSGGAPADQAEAQRAEVEHAGGRDEGGGEHGEAGELGDPGGEHGEAGEHGDHGAEHGGAGEPGEQHGASGHGAGHGHHRFDDPEAWAQRWDNAERDEWQQPERVIALMEITEGMSAADIGTGTGYFMPHLVEAVGPGGSVQCLDVEPAMVDYVNRRADELGAANAIARQVPHDDPQLAPGSVDRVLVVNTWHHLGDRSTYARRVGEGLAPGGAVFVVEYDMETEPGPPREMRLLPEQVIADFEAAGFVAEVVGTLPRQYVVRAALAGR